MAGDTLFLTVIQCFCKFWFWKCLTTSITKAGTTSKFNIFASLAIFKKILSSSDFYSKNLFCCRSTMSLPKNLLCLFTFLTFLEFTQATDAAERILGGKNCSIKEFPFLVSILSIEFDADPGNRCGGTLISLQWILTAAHCVLPERIKSGQVRASAGSDYPLIRANSIVNEPQLIEATSQIRSIIEGVIYPKYIVFNDIGLLKTETPFNEFPGVVSPANLPTRKGFTDECTSGKAAGWGLTEVSRKKRHLVYGSDKNDPLQCIELPVISQEACNQTLNQMHPGKYKIDSSIICTKDAKGWKNICHGDSGGPFVCDKIVVGIISAGSGCGLTPSDPFLGLFTKIEMFYSFINNITGIPIPFHSSPPERPEEDKEEEAEELKEDKAKKDAAKA